MNIQRDAKSRWSRRYYKYNWEVKMTRGKLKSGRLEKARQKILMNEHGKTLIEDTGVR